MRAFCLGLAIALPAGAALAQPMPVAPGETLVTISETGSAHLPADRLHAELSLATTSPDAAAAQNALNQKAAAALALIRSQAGVDAIAGGYSVSQQREDTGDREHPGPEIWRAAQTVSLTSRDASAILGLLGRLQQAGLTIDRLAWESDAASRTNAVAAATRRALAALRAEADVAAKSLGLHFASFRTVYLAPVSTQPGPIALMRVAAAPVTPLGAADAGAVEIRASGTALLTAAHGQPAAAPP